MSPQVSYAKEVSRLVLVIPVLLLSSCCLFKPTVRVIEKAAVTSIDVAGKAAGAGIDVVKSGYKAGQKTKLPAPGF